MNEALRVGRRVRVLSGVLFLASISLGAPAQTIFRDSFETPFGTVTSDAEAARFLDQATFGATTLNIAAVRAVTIEGWFDAQALLPATLARPFLESITVAENTAAIDLVQRHRINRWFDTAVNAPDQLRQKAAYALSQSVVVSDMAGTLQDEPLMMAEWNDILVRNAFGNYRSLIEEVARSPMMGRYLSHLRNRKFEITPRCADKLPPIDTANVDCTGNSATNNGTTTPTIVAYTLPTSGLVAPDENFAREVMQLFSIGLIERNLDFSPLLIGGSELPTYNQQMITTMARVMTGFSYACSGPQTVVGQTIARTCNCTGTACNFNTGNFFATPPGLTVNLRSGLVHPDRYSPMICYPRYHDSGRDRVGFQLPGPTGTNPVGADIVLSTGQTIPSATPTAGKVLELGGTPIITLGEVSPGQARGSNTLNCDAGGLNPTQQAQCVQYCDDELDAALDTLFNEPNTASMIARQLIQRLVTSNPSAAYIQRVAEIFVNNGSGTRGDLKAVFKAVLTDIEARRPLTDPATSAQFGKPREPILRLVQIWRSIGAVSGDTRADGYRRWPRYANGCNSVTWPQCAYFQRPLGSPTVFNFYEPSYQQPGAITTAGLFSPEFQIINENSSVLTGNDLFAQICSGYGTANDCGGAATTVPTDRAFFPTATLDALPGGNCGSACTGADDASLIEALNLRLLAGGMSGAIGDTVNPASASNTGMKGTLFRLLQTALTGSLGQAVAQDGRRREILYALHLIALSPEFSIQR